MENTTRYTQLTELGSLARQITAKVGCSQLKMGPRQSRTKSWRKILHGFLRDAHNTVHGRPGSADFSHKISSNHTLQTAVKNYEV